MIPNRWYPILEASKLGKKPVGVKRLDRKLVLWRDGTGRAVARPATPRWGRRPRRAART